MAYSSRSVYFVSREVQFDASESQGKKISSSKEPEVLTTQNVFLQLLVRGDLLLYKFVQANGREHYFISKPGDQPEELLDRYYLSSNSISVVHYEKWKQELINSFGECENMKIAIQRASYREKDMIELVQQFNNCIGSTSETFIPEQKYRKPQFGLVINPFFMKIYGISQGIAYSTTFTSNIDFGAGLSYEFFSRKKPNTTSFYHELKFRSINKERRDYFSNVSYQNIKALSAFRFTNPKSGLFWNIGIGLGYRFNTVTSPVLVKETSGFELGIMTGLGMKFSIGERLKGSGEIRYEWDGIQTGSSNPFQPQSLGIILGIQL